LAQPISFTASHLLVDIDDTLIQATKLTIPIREADDISYEGMFHQLWRESHPDNLDDPPDYTEDVCLFQLAGRCGLPLKELWNRMLKLHERSGIAVPDDAVAFLKQARLAGFTVCTATTNSRMTALGKLASGGMADFDGSPYISEFFGGDILEGGKSSPDFYRTILAKLGVPADRVVMIGDSIQADGRWAKEVGISQIAIIDRTATDATYLSPEGFVIVNNLPTILTFTHLPTPKT
jgi:FMN phosphatase YigB (HAD superfamily)